VVYSNFSDYKRIHIHFNFAGVPAANELLGILSFTKLFAATTELRPTEILFETNEPMPKKHFSPVLTPPARMVPGAKKF
jgi:hypothetical protein